jgi:hypothetical protein
MLGGRQAARKKGRKKDRQTESPHILKIPCILSNECIIIHIHSIHLCLFNKVVSSSKNIPSNEFMAMKNESESM